MPRLRRLAAWFAVVAPVALLLLAVPAARATLVHRYSFDGGNADDSVGGLDGTVFGTLGFDSIDPQQGTQAAVFSGDGYVEFASSAFSASQFTVTLWAKPSTGTLSFVEPFISNKGGGTVDGFGLWWLTSNGSAYVETSNGTTSNSAYSTAGAVVPGAWQHLAFAVDRAAGTAAVYRNAGDVTSDGGILTDFNVTGPWRMGLFTDGQYPLHATLDDVRVYDEVLDADAVRLIMTQPDGVIPEPVTLASAALLFGLAGLVARRRAGRASVVTAAVDARARPASGPANTGAGT